MNEMSSMNILSSSLINAKPDYIIFAWPCMHVLHNYGTNGDNDNNH